MKRSGIYLISEAACLKPSTGAYQHIRIGFMQLSKTFKVHLFLQNQEISIDKKHIQETFELNNSIKTNAEKKPLKGLIRDLYLLFKNHKKIFHTLKSYKKIAPEFIYERASYLNFSGLIIARLLRIPHYYEANGLQFEISRKYYESYFNKSSRLLEKLSYMYSTHSFFVGSYGDFWKIKYNNWSNIENGVENELIQYFQNHNKVIEDKVNICFIARLMAHQKPELLIDALNQIYDKGQFTLHLIGSGLDSLEASIHKDIAVVNHGFLNRNEIKKILSVMHVGIIAGSPEFQSAMKLFDYGCAKCAVIAPSVHNFKIWFQDSIVFFNKNDSESLAITIQNLLNESEEILSMGNRIYRQIALQHNWEEVFRTIVSKINMN